MKAVAPTAVRTVQARDIAQAWSSPLVTRVFTIVAALYFACIWLDAVHSVVPRRLLPGFITYFTEAAALFPNAALATIDYRVEGWECGSRRWREIDPRIDFPIDADNKENRFYRALHFFRQNRTVMQALDAYLMDRHNARARAGREAVGIIGGIRTLSLRLPIPAPGEKVAGFSREPLASFPERERHNWYWTRQSRRAENCGYPAPPSEPEASSEESHSDGARRERSRTRSAAQKTERADPTDESLNALQPSEEEP
jgi:hypothetical protein